MVIGPAEVFTTEQVMTAARLTYRQLDVALSKGYLPHDNPQPGSGMRREFTTEQRRTIVIYADLMRAGITSRTAAHIATIEASEYEHGATQIRVDTAKIDHDLNSETNNETNGKDVKC